MIASLLGIELAIAVMFYDVKICSLRSDLFVYIVSQKVASCNKNFLQHYHLC